MKGAQDWYVHSYVARRSAVEQSRLASIGPLTTPALLPRARRYVRRDLWRDRAIEIRVMFERNRNVRDPRAVAALLNEAEKEVQRLSHPDPYRGEFPFQAVYDGACRSGPLSPRRN